MQYGNKYICLSSIKVLLPYSIKVLYETFVPVPHIINKMEIRHKTVVAFDIYECDIMIMVIGSFGNDRQWLWITTDPCMEKVSSLQMNDKRLSEFLTREFGMRKREHDSLDDVVELLNKLVPDDEPFVITTQDTEF